MRTEVLGEEELFLVEGRLTVLQTSRTTQNLLEQIEKHAQAKNLASGLAAAASDMYGMVANSAAIAFYDGEDTYNFAAMLGERIICGTFSDANRLAEGDAVKAVVSNRGDVLYAHSVVSKKANLFLLPLMVLEGKNAFFRHCMSVALWGSVFIFLLLGGTFFCLWLFGENSADSIDSLIIAMLTSLLLPPLFMYPFEIWTYRSMRHYGYYASAIYKVLGIPRPDDFNPKKGFDFDEKEGAIMRFDKALDWHKAKFNIKG